MLNLFFMSSLSVLDPVVKFVEAHLEGYYFVTSGGLNGEKK